MRLRVAGLHVRLDAPARARGVLEAWLGDFAAPDPGVGDDAREDVRLEIDAPDGLSPDHRLGDPDAALRLSTRPDAAGRLSLTGSASGWFDPIAGRGALASAHHVGEVDALLRLAVSIALPARGGVLLHGCAVEMGGAPGATSAGGARDVAVLIGHSGAGKSTAAAAIGAGLGDELVAVRRDAAGLRAMGTPWWRGGPGERPVAAVCILDRGGVPGRERLVGTRALRAALPHVVRYGVLPDVDRDVFAVLADAVVRASIVRLGCPEGPGYLPFLRDALATIASHPPVPLAEVRP